MVSRNLKTDLIALKKPQYKIIMTLKYVDRVKAKKNRTADALRPCSGQSKV